MPKLKGRAPGFRMGAEHRTKIANSQILKALIEHVEGHREMTASQVTAGIALLKKVMPDLQPEAFDDGDGSSAIITKIQLIAAGHVHGED